MTDATSARGRNSGLIEPASVEEAADALARIWAQGGATIVVDRASLRVLPSDVVPVSLGRLDRILRLDRANSAIVVQAGVSVGEVQRAASAHGLWCPALRWLPVATTLGAAVAGGRGRRSRRYGAVVDYLLGTRFLSPSVGLVRHGGMAIKNASGYNLTATMAGSRGALGVVLEIILRLVPVPAHRSSLRFTIRRADDAWMIAREFAAPGLTADAVETGQEISEDQAHLLVEIEDVSRESLNARSGRIVARAADFGVTPSVDAPWPPFSQSVSRKAWRAAITPTRLVDTGVALVAAARRAGLAGWVLAEATGGSLELAAESAIAASELMPGIFGPREDSRVRAQLGATFQSAYDPDHRLRTD